MALETELKKLTAAVETLTEVMKAARGGGAMPENDAPAVQATPVPGQQKVPAQPQAHQPPPPPPQPQAHQPPPPQPVQQQAHQPQPTAMSAEQHKQMVDWALGELGKLQPFLPPQRMLEIIHSYGGEKVSEIAGEKLPTLVMQAQQEVAVIQASAPGVPQ